MKQERLNLYRIDMKYIRNLHNIDDRVSSVSPQIGKQHRIYGGTVAVCNEHKYVNGKMGWDKFCELSEVNERMFVSDYKILLSDEKMQYTNGNYIISRLIALGIMLKKVT